MRLTARGLFFFGAVLLAVALGLGGCRRTAFALLPPVPVGPQRTTDPFAPLAPAPGAGAAERSSTTVTAAGGAVDVGVSGAALLNHFLGSGGFFYGLYGTFEETDLIHHPEKKSPPAAQEERPPPAQP